ncbi:unnamed protein product [[Actinomadura] parvosata subsp. kistnae]|nr:unnamed protein product [Actinomadura parvosata subsp. kistnae]
MPQPLEEAETVAVVAACAAGLTARAATAIEPAESGGCKDLAHVGSSVSRGRHRSR